MARSGRKKRPATKLRFSLDVEVYRPELELFESMRYLDAAKLERAARAEIEVGYVKTDCCRQIVRALIQKGMVTALRIDASSKEKHAAAPPELTRLLNEVERKAPGIPERGPRLPVPVALFMNRASGLTTEGAVRCWKVCYKGTCVICCQSETTGLWLCSPEGFIIKLRG